MTCDTLQIAYMAFAGTTGSSFMSYIGNIGWVFVVWGLWFMVYGLWFMVYGLRFTVYGFTSASAASDATTSPPELSRHFSGNLRTSNPKLETLYHKLKP